MGNMWDGIGTIIAIYACLIGGAMLGLGVLLGWLLF